MLQFCTCAYVECSCGLHTYIHLAFMDVPQRLCFSLQSRISYFSSVSWAHSRLIQHCPLEAFFQKIFVPVKQKDLRSDQLHPLLLAMWHRYDGSSTFLHSDCFHSPWSGTMYSPAWQISAGCLSFSHHHSSPGELDPTVDAYVTRG